MAILENIAMASAAMQWLFHSGEQVAVHGPVGMITHLFLAFHKCDTDKQCRPRSDATFCGVLSGSTLFAFNIGISVNYSNSKN